jgi:myo-inositol-1(or 4)-monophosphatase
MDPLVVTALQAAEAAARIQLRHFGRFRVEDAREKGRSDFVSMVDLEAQEAALAVIRSRYPGHRILAEEETGGGREDGDGGPGARESDDERRDTAARRWPEEGSHLWIVDPLDGTTNYLHRHPMFTASVAVGRLAPEEEGTGGVLMGGERPGKSGSGTGNVGSGTGKVGSRTEASRWVGVLEAGAVVAPRTGERWWARRGCGAWKNGQPIRVSGLRSLRSALVGTGFPFKEPHLLPRYAEQFQRVLPASGGVRRGGSAALDLCYLAEGIFDAFWEEEYLAPWDVAAGLLLVQEAGGTATRLDGSPFDLRDGSVLAANSAELLRELGEVVRGEAG